MFYFGVFDIKTDAVELRKKALELSRLMRHRGPDWSGIYASDNAILAHERLSIVDVNAGAQPLYNQQKTHVLAVNGEIYNHQALRAEYGDRYQFQTGSDCEVILALYQEKADYLIQSGSRSPSVMERWVNKIATLEQKKQHYEEILRRELDGLDDELKRCAFCRRNCPCGQPACDSESGLIRDFSSLQTSVYSSERLSAASSEKYLSRRGASTVSISLIERMLLK